MREPLPLSWTPCPRPSAGRTAVRLLAALMALCAADDSQAADLLAEGREALARDAYDEAHESLRRALVAARSSGDRELLADVQEAQRRARAIERQFNSIEDSRERLKQAPDDETANTVVGRFYCFAKGDWQRGLPLLANGESGALRDAARLDLSMPDELAQQIYLGDSWIKAADESREGDERDQLHLRARHWYLQGLAIASEESQRELIDGRLDQTIAVPSKIVIYNTHNGPHNDRGTVLCNLILINDGERVFQQRLPLRWEQDISAPTTVRLSRRTPCDEVRIEVLTWHETGGGLAEVEVYQGEHNLALGAAATGDSSPDAAYRPDRLTDGNRGGRLDQEGIWLLSNGMRGSVVIELNRR